VLASVVFVREYRRLKKRESKVTRINAELDARITERTSALRLTQYSIDQSVDNVFWVNASGEIIYANNAACINLDYEKEKILELNITDILLGFTFDKWNNYWEILRKEGSMVLEIEFVRKSLVRFPVELTVNYIMHEEREYAFAFARDVSDRKLREENLRKAKDKAEESDKLKSAFLANMSHEIRTPMNAIIGFSDLLINDDITSEEKDEFVEIIKNSGETLLKLIDDIIDISLIEAGQLKVNIKQLDLNDCIREIHRFYLGELERLKRSSLEIRFKEEGLLDKISINADQIRFRQVLTNLIGNALKFTENGFIEVGYEVLSDSLVRIYVKDTGIGIPADKLDMVFRRFQKLDDIKRVTGGTGLGLTISQKLVKQMGGNLVVNSKYGVGSEFSFVLDYRIIGNEEIQNQLKAKNDFQKIYNWNNRSVLVVEDVESNFRFLESLLKKTGIEVNWAKDGVEALAFCKNTCPDAILMDIQLPGRNGYEITREILGMYPKVPIIAQTAYAFDNERHKILDAGCVDYLSKPINSDLLYSVMNKYL
jgi:PAS domain S-box-containing protein